VNAGVSITGILYAEKILPPMIADLKKQFGGEDFVFQQDGAGAHFAKVTTNFLEEEKVDFWPKGFWPGNSADLSPIANIWAVLKREIFVKGTPPTQRSAQQRIKKFFPDFDPIECEKYVNSF